MIPLTVAPLGTKSIIRRIGGSEEVKRHLESLGFTVGGTVTVINTLGGSDTTVWQTLCSAFTSITGYSFLVFNLLCAPCFAAIGAIKREMNSAKWTWFAIGYQCGFAYVIALMINQFGNAFTGNINILGFIVALLLLFGIIYMVFFKKYKEATKLTKKI